MRAGLSKESFVATGVAIACLVDCARLSVYARHFAGLDFIENEGLLLSATLSAFTGAFLGNRLLTKITMDAVRRVVAVTLFLLALALGSGVV